MPSEPRWWAKSDEHPFENKEAANIAATAIVAAKVYEAFQWVHYHGHLRNDLPADFHVCTAEELVPILTDLAMKALADDEGEARQPYGHLRFLAWATDCEPSDRTVDFYLSIGSSFLDRLDRLPQAAGASVDG